MSTAIDTLMAEHNVIEGVLSGLARYASAPDATPAGLARYVEFTAKYADAMHHSKEEDILFVILVDHGFSREAGPIAVMLHEHDEGRSLLGELQVASTAKAWSEQDRAGVAETASQLRSLLQDHIAKENNILYPMALSRLPKQAVATLDDRCATRDASNDERARLEQLAAELG